MPAFQDLTGQKFGRLLVESCSDRRSGNIYWSCLCDCGQRCTVRADRLKSGETKSCGCWHVESVTQRSTKHGGIRSGSYKTWQAMIERCRNPNNSGYHLYGARGVRVCPEWSASYQAFRDDMGDRPSDRHSIDRIDPNGDYGPSNCRWATPNQQARNRRDSNNLTLNGVTRNIADWSDSIGISVGGIKKRLRLGWTIEEALTLPIRPGFARSARRA
jgi:hypothetical protein